MPHASHCKNLNESTTRISEFPKNYVELDKHWFNKSSQPSTINKLYLWRITLQENLQETYVIFSLTSLQRTGKYHQFIWTILKKKWQKFIMTPSIQSIIFSTKLKNLPKHGDMVGCPYSHPQAIYKAYNILNKTGNFRDSINFWNGLPLIHKMWTAFKNNFADPIKKSLKTTIH